MKVLRSVALAAVLPTLAWAQASEPPCAVDSSLYRRSGQLTVYLAPDTKPDDQRPRAQAERMLIIAMQEAFTPPRKLDLRPWRGTLFPLPDGLAGGPDLTGRLEITLQASRAVRYSWDPAPPYGLKTRVDSALSVGTRTGEFRHAVSALPSKELNVVLHLRSTFNDSIPGTALMRAPISYVLLSQPARRISGPPPRYPVKAMQAGRSGYVDFEYIIDPSGHADSTSMRVLASTSPEFIEASRAAILATTFQPAKVGNCAVPQIVQQRISFQGAF
jgi:TonB family protein